MDGSVGQSTTVIDHDGPFLRTGPSGQIWDVVGKLGKERFYYLTDAGPVNERPDLVERKRQAFGPHRGNSEDT